MVTEIKEQLEEANGAGAKPAAVITSVGGGGLAVGLLLGMDAAGWRHVPLVAVEPEGAAALHASIAAGGKRVTLPKVDTICSSLAANTVTPRLLELAGEEGRTIISVVVSDRQALQSAIK